MALCAYDTDRASLRRGFRRSEGRVSAVTFIVGGGVLGFAVGSVAGGAVGYALGSWAVWKLLSRQHQRLLASTPAT